MLQEEWKPIQGYEGIYEISNYGVVKSIKRYLPYMRGSVKVNNKVSEKILFGNLSQKGYPVVKLSKRGFGKTFFVHLLVWDTFGNGNRDGIKIQVDHIDGNKKNPLITNLRLATNRQNTTYYHLSNRKNGLPIGVHVCDEKRINKYTSQIRINGIIKRLGVFPTVELASEAYQQALKTLIIH